MPNPFGARIRNKSQQLLFLELCIKNDCPLWLCRRHDKLVTNYENLSGKMNGKKRSDSVHVIYYKERDKNAMSQFVNDMHACSVYIEL